MTDSASKTSELPMSLGSAGDIDSAEQAPALRKRVVHGSAWTVLTQVTDLVTRMGSAAILWRLLSEDDFGLMAVIFVYVNGLHLLSDVGLGPNVIHSKRGDDPDFLNVAWTVQIIRGAVLWLAAIAMAWPIAHFYNAPMLLQIMPVIGVSAFIGGFNSMAVFSWQRHVMIGRLSFLDISTNLIRLSTQVLWALLWPNVWAFVAGYLASTVYYVVCSHLLPGNVRHRLRWEWRAWHELFHFGKWIFLSTLVTFLANSFDRLVLAKLIPWGKVGVYGAAQNISQQPQSLAFSLSARVLYPVLAMNARAGAASLTATVLRARRVILPVGLAAVLGLILCAKPILFGYILPADKLADAPWMLQLLTVAIWFGILQSSMDRVLLAVGRPSVLMTSNVIRLIVTAAGCLLGNWLFGLPGFILGIGLGAFAGYLVIQSALIQCGIRVYQQDLLYTLAGLAIGLAGALGPRFIAGQVPITEDVLCLITAVVILCPLSLWVLKRVKAEINKS